MVYPKVSQILLSGLLCHLLVQAAWCQETYFQASDQSFSIKLPASFAPSTSPPSGTILAVEASGGVSLFCSKQEPVELDAQQFADRMKRNLFDAGAQIFGKARRPLGEHPAASFLVGGVVEGKESLFVYNQRPDGVYTFVLNYPVGQRKQAAGVWNQASSNLKFKKVESKKKK